MVMADPAQRVSCGDLHFDFANLMAEEMVQVEQWTACKNRQEFYQAVRDENAKAVLAAFLLGQWRASGEEKPPRWGSVKVNLDKLKWSWCVDDRPVEMVVEEDADGPVVAVLDDRGRPVRDDQGGWQRPRGVRGERVGLVPVLDVDDQVTWRYADTKDPVRPTKPATRGSDGSPSTATEPGDSSGSPSLPLQDVSV